MCVRVVLCHRPRMYACKRCIYTVMYIDACHVAICICTRKALNYAIYIDAWSAMGGNSTIDHGNMLCKFSCSFVFD